MTDIWLQRDPFAFTGPRLIVEVTQDQIAAYERDLAWSADLRLQVEDTRLILKAADEHGVT